MRCQDDEEMKCRYSGDYSNSDFLSQVRQTKTNSWLSAVSQREAKTNLVDAIVRRREAKMNPIEKIINEKYDEL
jgi:hypothetical protein